MKNRSMRGPGMARLMALGLVIGLGGLALPLRAEEADHPADKPMVVGSDFGVAPWMMRGTQGPEGFGVDLAVAIISKK